MVSNSRIYDIVKLLLDKEMALFLNGNKIWEYSLLLMDCVFLQLELVYRRILLIVHGKEAQYLPK